MSYVTTVVSKQENNEENIRIHCQSQLMISLAVPMETDCKQNILQHLIHQTNTLCQFAQ